MKEKIEIGYSPAAFVGSLGIYHKYIIYTDRNGNQFIARGGPAISDQALKMEGVKKYQPHRLAI